MLFAAVIWVVPRQAPHKANYDGETPLLCAVQKGRRSILKALLSHRAGAARTSPHAPVKAGCGGTWPKLSCIASHFGIMPTCAPDKIYQSIFAKEGSGSGCLVAVTSGLSDQNYIEAHIVAKTRVWGLLHLLRSSGR
ncbi:unnamed protein product [Durusdinium trenchii]|uniref:Uncharacterized protein n=1 Tax=Durusdinium trenchii TaxID=1381693 RepID=A0ABP0NCF5_9DINO